MSFTDPIFFVFLAATLPAFFFAGARFGARGQVLVALTASYVFYGAWDWRFLALIAGSTAVDYFCGLEIARTRAVARRRALLALSIAANLGVLATFKYFNFFADSATVLLNALGMQASWTSLNIVLPVGISFFTFQSMSYTIDVYRRRMRAERSWTTFAAYVSLFPQLVAGPIVRARTLLPQLNTAHRWNWTRALRGVELMIWGYFLKVAMADNLAPLVDARFADPAAYGGWHMAFAAIAFAFQIYGDFAGYSLIAIGLGKILGYHFPVNFRRPYFAQSFRAFWRRWHISLSSWIRDYLYIPLGGDRGGRVQTSRNLALTMGLAGLWHGAAWTFVLWGLLHGAYLAAERALGGAWRAADARPPSTPHAQSTVASMVGWGGPAGAALAPLAPLGRMAVVFALVCVGWVLFRAQNLDGVGAFFFAAAGPAVQGVAVDFDLARAALATAIVLVVDLFCERRWLFRTACAYPALRALFSVGLVWLILLIGRFDGAAFLYFQF